MSDTVIFIYFDVDCDICHILLNELIMSRNDLKKYDIFCLSQNSIDQLIDYTKNGDILLLTDRIYHDMNYSFTLSFNAYNVPSFFMTTSKGIIINSQIGYPNIEIIKRHEAIQEN